MKKASNKFESAQRVLVRWKRIMSKLFANTFGA
jgi:hypothetical protein